MTETDSEWLREEFKQSKYKTTDVELWPEDVERVQRIANRLEYQGQRIAELEDALRAKKIDVNSAALSDANRRIVELERAIQEAPCPRAVHRLGLQGADAFVSGAPMSICVNAYCDCWKREALK